MAWESYLELGKAYGAAIGGGLTIGAIIALVNSWRP